MAQEDGNCVNYDLCGSFVNFTRHACIHIGEYFAVNTTNLPLLSRPLFPTKGEYANLFGCLCRAVGFDTRYISDFTDHVWTEVRVVHEGKEEWIMVDSCEGVVNEPSVSLWRNKTIIVRIA